MLWRSTCWTRMARPISATSGAASSGCDASEGGSRDFASAPHTCQSVRTWDQEVKQLGSSACNSRNYTTRDEMPKGRTVRSGKKEHPSTGLRRLRPEERCSGPGRCRNGRKRSGADRCARSGPRGASASDPTLCDSSGGGVSTLALVPQEDGASPSRSMVPRRSSSSSLRCGPALTGAIGRRLFWARRVWPTTKCDGTLRSGARGSELPDQRLARLANEMRTLAAGDVRRTLFRRRRF